MSAIPHALQSYSATVPSAVPVEIVCHCLRVSRDEIQVTIESGAAQSVKCVMRETGAGSGCTACHCTIRNMLEAAGHTVRCSGSRSRSPLIAADLPAFAR